MSSHLVFVDRRKGRDRRLEPQPQQQMHASDASPQTRSANKRHNFIERRDTSRNITDDYYAYMRAALGKVENTES